MSILSGWLKTRAYRKTTDGYKKESRDTSSETVFMNDGNTAETNLGDIKGITSSLASTSANYALSASAGKNLQDQVTDLSTDLAYEICHQGNNYVVTKNGNTLIIDITGLVFTNGSVSGESFIIPTEFYPKKPKVVAACSETDNNLHKLVLETDGQLYSYLNGTGYTGQLSGQIVLTKNN